MCKENKTCHCLFKSQNFVRCLIVSLLFVRSGWLLKKKAWLPGHFLLKNNGNKIKIELTLFTKQVKNTFCIFRISLHSAKYHYENFIWEKSHWNEVCREGIDGLTCTISDNLVNRSWRYEHLSPVQFIKFTLYCFTCDVAWKQRTILRPFCLTRLRV